jgi:hypothetical protein
MSMIEDVCSDLRWTPQPDAGRWLREFVDELLDRLPDAAAFSSRLFRESGNRLIDLIDTVWLGADSPRLKAAQVAGWDQHEHRDGVHVWRNPRGMFPAVCTCGEAGEGIGVDLKVEFAADFISANGIDAKPSGEHYSPYRGAEVFRNGERAALGIVERHGYRGYDQHAPRAALDDIYATLESFQTRRRDFDRDEEGFAEGARLIDAAVARVGRDLACDLFFRAEREYWQRRNRAAEYQKNRQDRLGIGWANHDHHTYRNSRVNFHRLVALWEKLGFVCRERFSPGIEAGWGAQVMEQPVCGIITFNDVDISPAELLGDFAHRPLEEWDRLHTVGLWCGLHGDSFLTAGMHHLECTFAFDALREQIQSEAGIGVMKPFTDLPYLRQAFTEGERWPVSGRRIDALLRRGLITDEQARQFRQQGAIGSHLENLERNDGFKGFNQKGVTEIIAATDPRRHVQAVSAR